MPENTNNPMREVLSDLLIARDRVVKMNDFQDHELRGLLGDTEDALRKAIHRVRALATTRYPNETF